jgi:hypothetical protein
MYTRTSIFRLSRLALMADVRAAGLRLRQSLQTKPA